MAITYHANRRGFPGSLVYLNAPGGNPANNGTVIQAVTVVDQAGVAVGSGTAASPTVTTGAPLPTGTNRSGSATTTSTTPIAANSARVGLYIQNIGANNIGYTEFGGTAAIGTAGTFTLVPGASVFIRTAGAISMIAATATTAFSATEW